MIATCLWSCDDTTDNIGGSVIDDLDNVNVMSETFPVSTSSVASGSVYSRSTIGYLGKIKDPETGAYIKSDFLAQFYTLEGTQLPEKSTIESKLPDGSIIADSCIIYLYYDNYFGDSLSTMKLNAIELAKPMEENKKYYSDFNPENPSDNYCRTDKGRVDVNKTYTLYDIAADTVAKKIKVKLPNSVLRSDGSLDENNAVYTARDGRKFYNYGTYLMQKYYENPQNYKNAYTFIHEVCPGFYFKAKDGLGAMAYINMSQMLVYYKYKYEKTKEDGTKKDTTVNVVSTFAGTEEVIQASSITNQEQVIDKLVNGDPSCTYVKSPAGIYTEMTIPVDDILANHENDTINSARVALTRINNSVKSDYAFSKPSTLLMLPKDSLVSFFENSKLADNKISYLAVHSSSETSSTMATENAYSFHNIANLISYMNNVRTKNIGLAPADKNSSEWQAWDQRRIQWEEQNPNWNKVLIVPVSATYVTINSTQILVKVENDMSIAETKFVRGDNTSNSKVKINVVYSKFQK